MIPYAKPTAALDQLPKQLREQIKPYFEYFDKKFKEIDLRKTAPLEVDDQGRLKLEYSDGSDANLEPGTYATGSFKSGKRAVMLGTVAGTVALYESSDTIDVPENVSADRKLQVPSFELHVPEVFWKAGLLKLTILGKVDLSTFIDLFGYPKQNNRDDHNRNNIANRLALIADALNLRPSAGFAQVEEAAFEQAAKICDLAIKQSEAESKQCLPHEFIEKAVFRGAIAQAKKLAASIRALNVDSTQALRSIAVPPDKPSNKQDAACEEPTAGYYYHHGYEAGKAAAQRRASEQQGRECTPHARLAAATAGDTDPTDSEAHF